MDHGKRWVRALYLSLLVGVAIITGSLFFVLSILNGQNNDDRSEYRQSMIWYTAQLVVEFQDLLQALDTFIVHGGRSADGEEVSARFDILWSRAIRLDEGEAGREFGEVEGAPELMSALASALRAADDRLAEAVSGDVAMAEKIRADFLALQPILDSFRSSVYRLQLAAATQQREELRQTVNLVLFLIIGLLVAGASMGGLLVRERQQLLRLGEQLERRVAERTAELARANMELRAANERLSQFNNLASHDLKEPVRKIAVFSDLLLEGVESGDKEMIGYAAGVMRASAGRARALISNLLTYSAASERPLEAETVRIDTLVERVCDSLSELIRERHARIDVDPQAGEIAGDAVFLEQLFQNLIGNAVKFADPDRPPHVRIQVERAEGGKPLKVHVSDNGIGFDMRHKGLVFEPFRRLHPRERYAGTGMGLAICAAIARRHGWELDADSIPGEGSRFTIDFDPPAATETAAREADGRS
ncbi:sensor histidine kinase [Stappia sp. ICDLI1TA098]